MKGQNGDAPAGIQASGKIPQKCLERGKLVIHLDTQGLENSADGKVALILVDSR